MKAKKTLSLLALVLSITCLAGCSGTDQKVDFNNYWNTNSLVHEEIHETLVYSVSYEKGSISDTFDYQLSYGNGSYTTELTSTAYDGKNAYLYKTELAIDVTYTFGGESVTLNDSITTETLFLSAENALRPVYSEKTLLSNSPTTGSITTLEDCYYKYHYHVRTDYTSDGNGTSVVTRSPDDDSPMAQTNDFEIEQDKYNYLDNEQLLLSLRAVSNSKSSAKVLVYSPFVNLVQTVSLSFSSEESQEFTFTKNGESTTKTIAYRPVSVVLSETNPGTTQTAWIAKYTNASANENRNVMLRLETPLYYNLGALVYQLKSVSYQ